MKELLNNILPYLGVETNYTEEELVLDEVKKITVPLVEGLSLNEAKNTLYKTGISYEIKGNGDTVENQFPEEGETINKNSKIILYTS